MKKVFIIFLIFDFILAIFIPIFLGINFIRTNKYDFAVIAGAELNENNQENLTSSLNWLNSNNITKVVFLGNMVENATENNYKILFKIISKYKKIKFYYYKGEIELKNDEKIFEKYFKNYQNQFIEFNNYNFYFYSDKNALNLSNINSSSKNLFIFSESPADNYYLQTYDLDLYNRINGKSNVTVCYNKNNYSPLNKKAFYKSTYASICVGSISDTYSKYKTKQTSSSFGMLFKVKDNSVAFNNVNFTANYIYNTNEYSYDYLTNDEFVTDFSDLNFEKIVDGNKVYISISCPTNVACVLGYKIELYNGSRLTNTITLASDYLFGDISNTQKFLMSAYDYGDLKSVKIFIIDINDNISSNCLTIPYNVSGVVV